MRGPADLATGDWRQAFAAAGRPEVACPHVKGHTDPDHPCVRDLDRSPIDLAAVAEVIALAEGRPHHEPWIAVIELRSGVFAAVVSSCCGVGWACHPDGRAAIAHDLETLLRHGLEPSERARLADRVQLFEPSGVRRLEAL